jgi:hypothetical protein
LGCWRGPAEQDERARTQPLLDAQRESLFDRAPYELLAKLSPIALSFINFFLFLTYLSSHTLRVALSHEISDTSGDGFCAVFSSIFFAVLVAKWFKHSHRN